MSRAAVGSNGKIYKTASFFEISSLEAQLATFQGLRQCLGVLFDMGAATGLLVEAP